MIKMILLAGAGGFFGSAARYLIQLFINRSYPSSFPYGTMLVNIIGCFIIGLIFGITERGNILSPEIRILVSVGFCGGFTTFSTFSIDLINLLRDGQYLFASVYIFLSLVLATAATLIAIILVKQI